MKTAQYIGPAPGDWTGDARLYRLSPPLREQCEDARAIVMHEYVVVSACDAIFSGPETYIFPADATGQVEGWGELDGSFRGAQDHARALNNAGYEVEHKLLTA